jgi:hypothetical protein
VGQIKRRPIAGVYYRNIPLPFDNLSHRVNQLEFRRSRSYVAAQLTADSIGIFSKKYGTLKNCVERGLDANKHFDHGDKNVNADSGRDLCFYRVLVAPNKDLILGSA